MKKLVLLFIASNVFLFFTNGQDSSVTSAASVAKQKIAVFVPLYLDSAFDAMDNYRYDKTFPKFINPGLEFYEGVQLAIDSMKKNGAQLEVQIFDTRSTMVPLATQLNSISSDNTGLIIAHPSASEIRQIADVAMQKNIPFINATAPINGGVTANPFYLQLTPTLKTQIETTYKYIQKYYPLSQLVVFRKRGAREDEIKSYFEEAGKTTVSVLLKLKYVDLPGDFSEEELVPHLDSTKKILCIAGSIDEAFGLRLASSLSVISKTYPATLMGMSTWNNISFTKPEFKGVEIVYGTPFYHARTDKASVSITNHFTTKMYARPSDMVFRGYEVFMRYANLYLQYKTEIANQLASKQYKLFNDFDIQPVLNRSNFAMEYFENKRMSFLRWKDGSMMGVNY